MEAIIPCFRRVTAGVDPAEAIVEAFASFEKDPTKLADIDRRRILDYPEPATDDGAAASSSSSSSSSYRPVPDPDLVRRAAASAVDAAALDDDELDFLARRFWPSRPRGFEFALGMDASCKARQALGGAEGWQEMRRQMDLIRRQVCGDEEFQAIRNAEQGVARRWETKHAEDMKVLDTGSAAVAPTRSWMRQLSNELLVAPADSGPMRGDSTGKKHWGFATYISPGIDSETRQKYLLRSGRVLRWDSLRVAGGPDIKARWNLQSLAWPPGLPLRDGEAGVVKDFNEESFEQTLFRLRESFHLSVQMGELDSGLQTNAFIVIDNLSANSLIGKGVDTMDAWVWAVDPDYCQEYVDDSQTSVYKGYLKLRLQQVVGDFFDARHFHGEEISMEELWKAGRKQDGVFGDPSLWFS